MRGSIRIAAVVAAALALAAGSASAASADSATITDKRTDVVLNGAVGGDRTTAQKGIAYGTDARSATFTLGKKYISVRVDMTTVRQDLAYQLDVTVSGRGERPDPVAGHPQLHVGLGPGGLRPYTTGTAASSSTMCGGGPPETRRTGQRITTGLKLGRGGYLTAQVPRACLGADPSSTKIERKASIKVSSPGRAADAATSTDRYEDFVSSTKYKTAKWTRYVRN